MDFKMLDVAVDFLMLISSTLALLLSIALMIRVTFTNLDITLHIIGESAVLAFFGAWGLLDWYREV